MALGRRLQTTDNLLNKREILLQPIDIERIIWSKPAQLIMILQRLRFSVEEKHPPSMQKNACFELPFAR